MVEAYIGIGSNLGDRRDLCSRALGLLGMLPHSRLIAHSSAYETEPVGDVGGAFVNLVARVDTELPVRRLLSILQETERGLGRDIDRRSGPRTMDIDLLFYGDQVIHDGELVVPHARLHERRFVLAPLA
ncbi:MAG: 2-amino-4-hydroxy-6-hydroxymethyldihydropteridine diphosphokinase, partial [Nitrospirota bacterium]